MDGGAAALWAHAAWQHRLAGGVPHHHLCWRCSLMAGSLEPASLSSALLCWMLHQCLPAYLPALPCPQVDHWVLVDAGAPNSLLLGRHASKLVGAVLRALAPARRRAGEPPAQLDLIIRKALAVLPGRKGRKGCLCAMHNKAIGLHLAAAAFNDGLRAAVH